MCTNSRACDTTKVLMYAAKRKEDDNAGDDDYDDVSKDVDGAWRADASALCFFLSTTDVGGRL